MELPKRICASFSLLLCWLYNLGVAGNEVPSRILARQEAVNVKGTWWGPSSDTGGCQMPEGSYAVVEALALGQEQALGDLKWRQPLCGLVLNVNCGHGDVEAVVVSTCNLGSDTCGVDLIDRTWNLATDGMSPGITSCAVSVSARDPLEGAAAPACYHRPYSDVGNPYYTSVGVFNTGGRLTSAAWVAGIPGNRQAGSGYFDFNGDGQLTDGGVPVRFEFEDGSSAEFTLADCKFVDNVHIFERDSRCPFGTQPCKVHVSKSEPS